MKSLSWFLASTCLLTTTSFAQATTSKRTTAITQTSSATTVSNRQQELYDQYHGYNKKAVVTSTTTTSQVSPVEKPTAKQPVEKVAAASTAKTNSSTTDTNERTSKKSKNQPASQPVTIARVDALRQPESIEGNPASRFRIGIRGGVTYPIFLEKDPTTDPSLGFVGGVTFTLGRGAVSFQPEVNYVRNSAKSSFLNLSSTYAVDFIQVPLLLKFSSGSYAGSRFFFNVGPYASYAMSASIDGKKYSLDSTPGRFGFGAAAGVGAAIKAGPGHVTVEVRGLYPLGDTDNGFNTNSKTIFGQGTLGYMFPIGGGR